MSKPEFNTAKILSAPQNRVKELERYVDMILEACGHPEAYVTDESTLGDFFEFGLNKLEQTKETERVRKELGVDLSLGDYLYEIAVRLKRDSEAARKSAKSAKGGKG